MTASDVRSAMEPHSHLTPEDAVERVLQAPSDLSATDADCPVCAERLSQAADDVRRVRGAWLDATADGARDDARAEQLAQAILSRTTREDLSWRGDSREVLRYLRGRLAASPALRLLAASLLLHLLAMPVLAVALVWQMREAPRGLLLSIEPPVADALPIHEVPIEPRRELSRDPDGLFGELPTAVDAQDLSQPEPARSNSSATAPSGSSTASDRLAQARRLLLRDGAPARSATRGEPSTADYVERALAARSRRLRLEGFDATLEAPTANAPLVEAALWAEFLLDDWVIRGRPDARLAGALRRLEAAPPPAGSSADAALVAHALSRARSYGASVRSESTPAEALPAFDAAWFRSLEAARGVLAGPSTQTAAWIAWGRDFARR